MNQQSTFNNFTTLWDDLMPDDIFSDLVKFHILDFLETYSMKHGLQNHFKADHVNEFLNFTHHFYFTNEQKIIQVAMEFLKKSSRTFGFLDTNKSDNTL